jgi:HEAT repeat protein
VQFLGVVQAPASVVPLLLAATDEALAEVALATLGRFGDEAEAILDGRWDALDVAARATACELLGRTGGACGAARLVAALEDADPTVRIAAACGLARRADPLAVRALLRRLEATAGDLEPEAEDERAAATEALVRIATDARGEDARRGALALLADGLEGAAEPVRLAIARVLREVGGPEHVGQLSLLVQDPSAAVRRAAVAALARLRDAAGAEMLHLALADEDAAVRSAAAAALGESALPDTLSDLERLLADEDAVVRAAAVRAVATLPPALLDAPASREHVEKLLGVALTDVAPVAIAAVEAYERLGGRVPLGPVRGVVGHPDPEVVQGAVRCLARHGSDDDVQALLPLLSHAHWAVRADAIQAFADRGLRAALPPVLRRLEREQDEFVRDVLLRALARLEEG